MNLGATLKLTGLPRLPGLPISMSPAAKTSTFARPQMAARAVFTPPTPNFTP